MYGDIFCVITINILYYNNIFRKMEKGDEVAENSIIDILLLEDTISEDIELLNLLKEWNLDKIYITLRSK